MSMFRRMGEILLGQGRMAATAQRRSPKGLGGYKLHHIGVEILDPRQKTGVKIWRAMLIEKNKYAPRFGARS